MDNKDRNRKKNLILIESNSPEETRELLRQSLETDALRGKVESAKLLREIQAEDTYRKLISNSDDDEYEFA